MKKLIKSSLLTLCIFLMAFTALPNILPTSTITPIEVHAEEISPRADVIYWVYRTLSNGTVQKRRWNETRGYWVDPHWINVN